MAAHHAGGAAGLSARLFNVALFLFVSITLTNAALVDYRTVSAGQAVAGAMTLKQGHGRSAVMMYYYLQARKYSGLSQSSEFAPPGSRWRGVTRSEWTEAGLCCGVFEILVKLKGGNTRVRLLTALSEAPRNKLQLADYLGIDWKAVDRHVVRLLEFGLVSGYLTVGTSTVFSVTEKGKRALELAARYSGMTDLPPDCVKNC